MGELEALRVEVGELREWKGAHEAKLEAMQKTLADNTKAIETLVATMNRGRGAVWAFTTIAVAAGSGVTMFIEWVRH